MIGKGISLQKPDTSLAAFVADTASLIGDVILAKDSNVWFNAVLRADIAPIEIGEGSNVQDGTVCHVDHNKPIIVGKGVTIGHNVTLHGCKINDYSLIGMGAIVLDGAEVGTESLIGAGAVVTAGTKIPPKSLVLGTPAKVIRELTEEEINSIKYNGVLYVELAKAYVSGGK